MTSGQFIFESVWFVLMGFFVYYLLVIKPGMQKADQQKKFVSELKKNDEVLTTGGLLGRVVQVKPDAVTLEVAQNVRIRVHPDHVRPVGETKVDEGSKAKTDAAGEKMQIRRAE